MYRFRLWAWSSHFWRRAAASTSQRASISKAVAYLALSSLGMRSICCTLPSKYFRSLTMTLSHRPSALRSWTREGLTTVNSPDRFDFTNRFWYAGSMDWDTPTMLEMVAVGAMAMTLLLRMPCLAISSRIGVQSW